MTALDLRCLNAIPPITSEQIDQERQRAEQAKGQLVQVARSLLTQGMNSRQVAELVGLSVAQVEELAAEA